MRTRLVPTFIAAMALGVATTVHAQGTNSDDRFSLEFGVGGDMGLTGQANASGIGTLSGQRVVITSNSYGDVYGSGLHIRFGGGYTIRDQTELRATFTFQSLDADFVTPMGDIGVSRLYGQYTDYQTFGLDVGLRRYAPLGGTAQVYGEATIGLGFVDEVDVTLVAPGVNLSGRATDFYDQTAAFALGGNVGLLFQTTDRVGFFGQLGLRRMSGMSEIDDLAGTGLETINDKSSRWTMPIIVGIRATF